MSITDSRIAGPEKSGYIHQTVVFLLRNYGMSAAFSLDYRFLNRGIYPFLQGFRPLPLRYERL